jgi:hypothetical protein
MGIINSPCFSQALGHQTLMQFCLAHIATVTSDFRAKCPTQADRIAHCLETETFSKAKAPEIPIY